MKRYKKMKIKLIKWLNKHLESQIINMLVKSNIQFMWQNDIYREAIQYTLQNIPYNIMISEDDLSNKLSKVLRDKGINESEDVYHDFWS